MKPFKVMSESTVFEIKGRYKIISVDLETPHGEKTTWSYLSMKDGAVIVPIDTEGNTYIKREWRASRKDFVWEFASGWIENEDICAGANRELQEEIGLKAENLHLTTSYYPSNHSDNRFHIVIATNLTSSKLPNDEHEYLEVKKVSLGEARKLLFEDQIPGGQTIIAFHEYENYLKQVA